MTPPSGNTDVVNQHPRAAGRLEIELCEDLAVPCLEWTPEGGLRLRMAPSHDLDHAFHTSLPEFLEEIRAGLWSIFASNDVDRGFTTSTAGVIIHAMPPPEAPHM